jgi:hypothetical protein
MAADRLVPTSATPGAVTGDDFMDATQDEITGLWNVSVLDLADIAGTANAITATVAPALTGALAHGMAFWLKPTANNTNTVTLKIGSLSAVAVVDKDGNALGSGDLVSGRRYLLLFDGVLSKFVVVSDVGDPAAVPTSYVDRQPFTASGTWTRPSRATATSMTLIRLWGAGGGGGNNSAGGGGGGGGYNELLIPTLSLGATETVTIPAGGAVNTAGGTASFGSHLSVYGGGAGGNAATGGGGGGGGLTSAGGNGTGSSQGDGGAGGGPAGAAATTVGGNGAFGLTGGGGGKNNGDQKAGGGGAWGGGGGGSGGGGGDPGGNGGGAISGGGGGGGGGAGSGNGTGGTSIHGGNGGNAGSAGSARGGGGGAQAAGGRGEAEIITYI